MLIRQISRGSPEQVFVVIKNATAGIMSIGRGVVFDYLETTQADGYNVSFRTTNDAPGLLAGIIASHDVGAGKHGVAQCYGHVDKIYIHNIAGSTAVNKDWDTASYSAFPLVLNITNDTLTSGAGGFSCLTALTATDAWDTTLKAAFVASINDQVRHYKAPVWGGTTLLSGLTTNDQTEGVTTGFMTVGFIKAM